jgi:hypothetical protein
MTDSAATVAYDELLASIGQRAEAIGPRRLASHWPHIGNIYRGLVIAGQALQGWDAAVSGSRWYASDAQTSEGRAAILERTRTWFDDEPDPVGVIATLTNRRGSPFWRLCRDVTQALEPDMRGPWYSRFAWANVYPVGPDEPPGSPSGPLKEAQDPYVGDLFAALIDNLEARRVAVISGPAYWWHPARSPAFAALSRLEFPLLRGGRSDGRTIVVAYHPTFARRKGVGAQAYAARIVEAFRRLDRES